MKHFPVNIFLLKVVKVTLRYGGKALKVNEKYLYFLEKKLER